MAFDVVYSHMLGCENDASSFCEIAITLLQFGHGLKYQQGSQLALCRAEIAHLVSCQISGELLNETF